MILYELIQLLASARIKLPLEDGALSVSGPKGVVTSSILKELKMHKPELIKYLDGQGKQNQRITYTGRKQLLRLSYAQQRL